MYMVWGKIFLLFKAGSYGLRYLGNSWIEKY